MNKCMEIAHQWFPGVVGSGGKWGQVTHEVSVSFCGDEQVCNETAWYFALYAMEIYVYIEMLYLTLCKFNLGLQKKQLRRKKY